MQHVTKSPPEPVPAWIDALLLAIDAALQAPAASSSPQATSAAATSAAATSADTSAAAAAAGGATGEAAAAAPAANPAAGGDAADAQQVCRQTPTVLGFIIALLAHGCASDWVRCCMRYVVLARINARNVIWPPLINYYMAVPSNGLYAATLTCSRACG